MQTSSLKDENDISHWCHYYRYLLVMKPLTAVLFLAVVASINAAYSPKLALQMAYMSSIAYEPIASINAWNCSRCYQYPLQNVAAFNNPGGDLQGFAGYSSTLKGIIVAFRGSSNIKNWITNL